MIDEAETELLFDSKRGTDQTGLFGKNLTDSCSMGHLLIRAIHRGGDRVAFVQDDCEISYRAFGDRLSQLIQVLKAYGLSKGEPVAVLAGNRIDAYLVSSAAFIMGLRLTLLSPLSSVQDQNYILRDAGISTLFYDPQTMEERVLMLVDEFPGIAFFSLGACDAAIDILAEAALYVPQLLIPEAVAEDLSSISYTGGTSGRPKGVMHTHRARVTMTMTMLAEWDWPQCVRFLATTPVSHASGTMIPPVLLRSGTVVLTDGFDPTDFFTHVAKHRITTTFMVPTMIYRLLDSPVLSGADLSSLAVIVYGAAAMSPARMIEAREKLGPIFMQLYGQTEAPMCITAMRCQEHELKRLASCGLPIGNSQVALLNDDGQAVAEGDIGEVCVRGPLLMSGYWNKPEETQAAFRNGWLRTGDLARQDAEGYLFIVDRCKDMIISGGFNVYPREVEEVLMEHSDVVLAAVFGIADVKWGEAVQAVVVLKLDSQVDESALKRYVREKKGAVQSPKKIFFVDEIPVTALGKPDKKRLKNRYGENSNG